MSAPAKAASPMALGLYFIDVLACLLFCLTLALVGANFRRETTVPIDLPRLSEGTKPGPDLSSVALGIREGEAVHRADAHRGDVNRPQGTVARAGQRDCDAEPVSTAFPTLSGSTRTFAALVALCQARKGS